MVHRLRLIPAKLAPSLTGRNIFGIEVQGGGAEFLSALASVLTYFRARDRGARPGRVVVVALHRLAEVFVSQLHAADQLNPTRLVLRQRDLVAHRVSLRGRAAAACARDLAREGPTATARE